MAQWEYCRLSMSTSVETDTVNKTYSIEFGDPDGPSGNELETLFEEEGWQLRYESEPGLAVLNALGAVGWELVALHGIPSAPIFWLKRPRPA